MSARKPIKKPAKTSVQKLEELANASDAWLPTAGTHGPHTWMERSWLIYLADQATINAIGERDQSIKFSTEVNKKVDSLMKRERFHVASIKKEGDLFKVSCAPAVGAAWFKGPIWQRLSQTYTSKMNAELYLCRGPQSIGGNDYSRWSAIFVRGPLLLAALAVHLPARAKDWRHTKAGLCVPC